MTKKILKLALFGSAILTATVAFAAVDTSQALLDLLVKKGLVSAQEAADLKAQAQANADASNAAPAVSPSASASVPMGASGEVPAKPIAASTALSPLSFRIGAANFTPLGFLDFTSVYRSTLNGGGIGSSFGSVPYSNTAAAQLSETRFSAQNSRLGLRIDSNVGSAQVLGYVEGDFLGNAPNGLNVTSNADTLRMRVYFADVKAGSWEFLAGQDWSMLTPNRKGISPIPGDIFYTQNVDTNYQVGLVWTRQPQVRILYHPDNSLTLGLSAENPDQYVGSAEVLPAGFNAADVDQGSVTTATPNVIPDMIGKIAYDGNLAEGMPFHIEGSALYREFKVNSFTAGSVNANTTASGYGGAVNSSLTVAPGLSLFENFFTSKGGARYISTSLGPDFAVRPADSTGAYDLSPIVANSGMLGAEFDATPMTKLFAYYGTARFQAKYSQLANGSYVGFGYPGSPNSMNKQIDEYTVGLAQTLWKNPNYGDLKILTQFSYLERTPFFVAPGAPSNAHLNMIYADLRYDLP